MTFNYQKTVKILVICGATLATLGLMSGASLKLREISSEQCSKSQLYASTCGECSVNGKPGRYSGSTCLRCN